MPLLHSAHNEEEFEMLHFYGNKMALTRRLDRDCHTDARFPRVPLRALASE